MATTSTLRVRSTPDLVGYVRATATALAVFAVALALTGPDSWPMVPVVALVTVAYGFLPASLLGALTAVTVELVALRTSSVTLQVLVSALVGGLGTLVCLPDAGEIPVLVALAAAIGRLSLEVPSGP